MHGPLADDVLRGGVRRILAVRFGRLGDVLFTTPALSMLADALPDATLDYLTRPVARPLVAHHPAVSEVLDFEPGWYRPGQLRARRELRAALARRGYDLALIFESDAPTRRWLAALCRGAGIRHVVSRSHLRGGGGAGVRHSAERHARLLTLLGLEPDERSYRLYVGAGDAERAERFLAERGVADDAEPPLVGLQIGSHYARLPEWLLRRVGLRHKFHKAWPAQRWAELGSRLSGGLGARLLLTGVAGERQRALGVARAVAAPAGLEPIVAAGETDVGLLAALVARTRLFVSIDTGTMHMAAALGIPTLALFGPTNPEHHGPYRRQPTARVLRSGIACSPCGKAVRRACRANRCMTELSAGRVFEAARGLWEDAGQRRAVLERSGRNRSGS